MQPEYDREGSTAISWQGNRVTAFSVPGEALLLDTAKPAGDLVKTSRQVIFPATLATGTTARGTTFYCDSPAIYCDSPAIASGDGTRLVCFGEVDQLANPMPAPVPLVDVKANAIGTFSATTGKLLSLDIQAGPDVSPATYGPGLGRIAWLSSAGDTLVAYQITTKPHVSGQPGETVNPDWTSKVAAPSIGW
jgi:hypothetical protein